MRKVLAILFVMVLLPFALAVDLDVEKLSSDEVLIKGLSESTNFKLSVTNNGNSDTLSFYTFFEGGITPTKGIAFKKGETKEVDLKLSPRSDSNLKGIVTFSYFIQGNDRTEIEEKLRIKMINLEEAFIIGAEKIDAQTKTLTIFIENTVGFDFEELNVEFSSPFFTLKENFSIDSDEKKEFEITLDKEDFNELMAGFYTLYADVETKGVSGKVEGKIEFVENPNLKTTSETYGFIISTKVITKVNEGNTISETEATIKKNIFSRLFTTFSPNPDSIERRGTVVYYSWTQRINPGENAEIKVKTNWFIPFLLVFFAVLLVYFVKKYTNQKLSIKKRVSFVKAKGGEFALKVTIIAQAREYMENIKIVDRLPPLVKLYERFAGELPNIISRDKQRLEWDFTHLEAGESRIMSYVVYSKLGILGKFALPATVARFEQEGKRKQTSSNKVFFLAEQKRQ